MNTSSANKTHVRGTATAAVAFYLLIALEFFYMASPFAAYLYTAYQPVLGFLQETQYLAWLNRFFLPHITAQTKSALIDMHEMIGAVLFLTGLLAFLAGACHIYFNKLTKRGAALGGIYKHIRHPQYTALAVSGLGMLLLWPRYFALVLYVVMLFVYRALARLEERECLARFGAPYRAYMAQTGRFLPFRLPSIESLQIKSTGWPRHAMTFVFLVMSIGFACLGAMALESYAIGSLYIHQTQDAVYLAIVRTSDPSLEQIVQSVESDPKVSTALNASREMGETQLINYVVPASCYVSEIPMRRPSGAATSHVAQKNWTTGPLKIVFTRAAQIRPGIDSRSIFTRNLRLEPLLEAVFDPTLGRVVSIEGPATDYPYQGIPVPMY